MTLKDPKRQSITLSRSKCALVCVYTVHGGECFLFGRAFALVSVFLHKRGSLLYVLSFRAASSVPVGCWPLYFSSWWIFCVACYCWRRLGEERYAYWWHHVNRSCQKTYKLAWSDCCGLSIRFKIYHHCLNISSAGRVFTKYYTLFTDVEFHTMFVQISLR